MVRVPFLKRTTNRADLLNILNEICVIHDKTEDTSFAEWLTVEFPDYPDRRYYVNCNGSYLGSVTDDLVEGLLSEGLLRRENDWLLKVNKQ